MRIGITGDTHGSAQAIRRILQQTPPIELWLHTGDYAADANRLHDATGIKTVRVRGNCDLLDDGSKYDEYLEIEGYKIWLTSLANTIGSRPARINSGAGYRGVRSYACADGRVLCGNAAGESRQSFPPPRRLGALLCGANTAGGADAAGGIFQGLSRWLRKFCAVSKNRLTIPRNDVVYTEISCKTG